MLWFEWRGTVYLNNSAILVENIGEEKNALHCLTANPTCCGNPPHRSGEFYFPNDTLVPISGSGQNFYRNRGDRFIRLNRRNDANSPTGRYRCELPDTNEVMRSIFIDIGKVTGTCVSGLCILLYDYNIG